MIGALEHSIDFSAPVLALSFDGFFMYSLDPVPLVFFAHLSNLAKLSYFFSLPLRPESI